MDLTARGIVLNWLPQLPLLLRTSILAVTGRSPNATDQEWLTEVLVQSARPILRTPAALLASQELFNRDFGVWGRMWVAKYAVPPPSKACSSPQSHKSVKDNQVYSLEDAFSVVFDKLALREDEKQCLMPPFSPSGVEAEWTSYRPDAKSWSRQPRAIPQQIYNHAIDDLPAGENSPVILYAHGGAFCLMDPANHRPSTSQLARQTNSRVLSVRYRLSPQNIFPAALMDMVLAYLALISPPPGAFHRAVPANRIILAGDSSGGNLVAALQIMLIKLVQERASLISNPWGPGQEPITILNPPTAGLSLTSPWLDITRSLPSTQAYANFDFIAPSPELTDELRSTSPLFPPDTIWPSNPLRTETYCEARFVAHPLVSPLMAPRSVLKDFPSTYVSVGWEGMSDEGEVFIRKVAEAVSYRHGTFEPELNTPSPSQHKSIVFDGYTAQPHTFSFIAFNEAGRLANQRRAKHIRTAVDRILFQAGFSIDTGWTNSKTLESYDVQPQQLGMQTGRGDGCGYNRKQPLTDSYVSEVVEHGRAFRVRLEANLTKQAGNVTLPRTKDATSNHRPLAMALPVVLLRVMLLLQYEVLAIILELITAYLRDFSFSLFQSLLWRSMQLRLQL